MYLVERPGLVTNVHSAVALGVARKALDAGTQYAVARLLVYNTRNPVAHLPVYQRTLGKADLRLRAARPLNGEVLEDAWRVVNSGDSPGPTLRAQLLWAATCTSDVAANLVSTCFRYAGGEELFASKVLQICLRNINAVAQHQMVSVGA